MFFFWGGGGNQSKIRTTSNSKVWRRQHEATFLRTFIAIERLQILKEKRDVDTHHGLHTEV